MSRNLTHQVLRGVVANRPALASGEFYFATDTGELWIGPTPTKVGPSAGSGGAQGTATLNFGAFPGSSDTSVAVTGQAGILAGSIVRAWIFPAATADHSADEHFAEGLYIVAGSIVAGTGFTIYGRAIDDAPVDDENLQAGILNAPFRYGQWNVAWSWS